MIAAYTTQGQEQLNCDCSSIKMQFQFMGTMVIIANSGLGLPHSQWNNKNIDEGSINT